MKIPMTGVSEGREKLSGIYDEVYEAWRKFVDECHNLPPQEFKEAFMRLWYVDTQKLETVAKDRPHWKQLVQSAFYEGFEAGFSTRILKGDVNE